MPASSIPIFKLEYDEDFRRRLHESIDRVLDEAYLTNHTFARRFEKEFANWNQSKFAVMTNSGTSALEILLRAIDVHGREVIVPTNTFVATAQAVIAAGGRPVVADIEQEHLALDLDCLKSLVNHKTRAILTVHIAGMISPGIEKLAHFCREHDLALLEDCAHAHGAHLRGVRAGTFGLGGAFSFHLTKVMSTGEGGMAVTNEEWMNERLVSVRQFGKAESNSLVHVRTGGNFKATEMQAAMGLLELERVDARIAKRAQLALIYQNRLNERGWKALKAPPDSFCPYYKQVVLSPFPREKVEKHLAEKNISLTGGVYYHPLHRQPMMQEFLDNRKFPIGDLVADTHICPPCYPELSVDDVERICDALLEIA